MADDPLDLMPQLLAEVQALRTHNSLLCDALTIAAGRLNNEVLISIDDLKESQGRSIAISQHAGGYRAFVITIEELRAFHEASHNVSH